MCQLERESEREREREIERDCQLEEDEIVAQRERGHDC